MRRKRSKYTNVSTRKRKKNVSTHLTEKRYQFSLTDEDRISRIYKQDEMGVIREVTCVSYDILIEASWVTLVYYDTYHGGSLHRHTLQEWNFEREIVDTEGIKKNLKTIRAKLTWAMSNVTRRYPEYRRSFIKRNKVAFRDHNIEIY